MIVHVVYIAAVAAATQNCTDGRTCTLTNQGAEQDCYVRLF
jgi:hypothetical protein